MTGEDAPDYSWTDWTKDFYLLLMQQGYKLNEIDEMDIYYYWELLRREDNKRQIDDTKVADEMGI